MAQTNRLRRLCAAAVSGVAVVSVFAVGTPHALAAPASITDLGALPGQTTSSAYAVNDDGQVVGDSTAAGAVLGEAFSWTAGGGMIGLGTLGGAVSHANAVSDSGQVVGYADIAGGYQRAFSWTAAGGMVDLGTLGGYLSEAFAVNDSGQVVGESVTDTGDMQAFSWTAAGGMVDLGDLGGYYSKAVAVNNDGQVVGTSFTAGNQFHAFSWTASGGMVDLGDFGGGGSQAVAINNNGQVVGSASTSAGRSHAFSWTAPGGMVDLGTLPTALDSSAIAVNDDGLVVGNSDTTDGTRAFAWTPAAGMVNLGTLPGGTYSTPVAVSASGLVVGDADTADGQRGFTWMATAGMTKLDTLPEGGTSSPNAVNSSGLVVGYAATASGPYHAVVWQTAGVAGPPMPTVTLSAAPGQFAWQPNSFTVSVTDSDNNPVCTGSVSLFDNGSRTPLNASPMRAAGSPCVFAFNNTFTSAGTHSVVAVFNADEPPTYLDYTSLAVTFTQGTAPGSCTGEIGCSEDQNIQANIPPGTLSISTPYTATHPLNLGTLGLDSTGTMFTASASFGDPNTASPNAANSILVTDTRAGDLPWTAQAQASTLSDGGFNPGSAISGENVGLTKLVVLPVPGNGFAVPWLTTITNPAANPAVAPGDPGTAGLGNIPHDVAQTNYGIGSVGVAGLLTLNAPSSTEAGLFTGTITFTIVGGLQ